MESTSKRVKLMKETIIEDVASILEDMSESVTSIGKSHEVILHLNRAATLYHRYLLDKEQLTLSIHKTDLEEDDKSQDGGSLEEGVNKTHM